MQDDRAHCLNCGDPLRGAYCARCGQRAIPPHPTVRELAGDAYAELVGWDGKFAVTLRALMARPGELTREFLEGRRARFVSPVRLYLMCSLVYFVAAAMVAPPVTNADKTFEISVGVGFNTGPGEETPGEAALRKAVALGLAALTPEERTLVETEIASQPRVFQPVMRALAEDAAGLQRRALEMMPRALFLLIPALAAILALFHRGRHYPDHLYFAVHLQTFSFVVLTLAAAAQYRAPLWLMAVAQITVASWILVYAVIAQRRVYGGTWLGTVLKSAGTAVIYGVLWTAASFAVTVWVSRSR